MRKNLKEFKVPLGTQVAVQIMEKRKLTPKEKIHLARYRLNSGRNRALTRQGALNNISLENQSTKCGHNFSRYKVSDRNRMNPLGW